MRKIIVTVFVLLLFTIHNNYSQSDSVLSYLPLHIGNQWQYKIHYIVNNSNIDTIYYSLVTVTSDTVMPNGYHYEKLASDQETTFVHIDSASACVYEYEYNAAPGFMTDSLRCSEGDWFGENIYCELIDTATILDYNTWIMIINRPWPDISESHTLAMNIGTVNKEIVSTIGYGSIKTYELVYAKILGIEYGELVTSSDEVTNEINSFILYQNYPNPFNPSTTIGYSIPERGFVTLKVYDVLGNEIATLVDEEKPAGSYEVEFSAKGLTSGIYFYKISTRRFIKSKKMMLLR